MTEKMLASCAVHDKNKTAFISFWQRSVLKIPPLNKIYCAITFLLDASKEI
jgi:hypothetical protein